METGVLSRGRIQVRLANALVGSASAFARFARREISLASRTMAGRVGLGLVLLHVAVVVIGPTVSPYSPTEFHLDHQLVGPSGDFWLGTDQFGRDVLSRVLSGGRTIIGVTLAGATLGIAAGTAVGMVSAYIGGKTDEITMRIADGMMSFPSLLFALLVLTTLGSSAQNIVLTIGIVFTPRTARVMRVAMMELKPLEFVQNARLRGESKPYIIFREILPNTLPTLAVESSVRLSYAVLLASSLGFLGLGVQPPSSDWGLMISESREFLAQAPWVIFSPIVAVVSLIVGINLLSEGLRRARGLPTDAEGPVV